MALSRAKALRARAQPPQSPAGVAKASAGSYRATKTDRARPIVRDGGGDRHADDGSRRIARELARDQDRSSGIYRQIVTAYLDLTIGECVMPIPGTGDPEWNKKALELFTAEAKTFDVEEVDGYGGLQRKWARAVVNDGDMLLVKVAGGKLATVEADRVAGRKNINQHRRLVGGVLLDAITSKRLEYGVCPYDAASFLRQDKAQWYPADQCIYCGTSSRKSQVRSLPALVASLDDSERADSLIESEVISAEQASMIWGFIKDAAAGASGERDPLGAANSDGTAAMGGKSDRGEVTYQDWIAGTLAFIGNREFEAAQVAKPNLNVVQFLIALMRIFGAELGVPYEIASLDVGALSWSGNKALLAFAERRQQVWRGQVYGPMFSDIYLWRIQSYIQRGLLADRSDWFKHDHAWPATPAIDGPDQVTTDKGNLEIGKTSLQRLVGRHWEQIQIEQSVVQKLRDRLAIERIGAIEEQLQKLREKYPGLQSLSWSHIITLGGAISAPGAYLAAAVGKPGEPAPTTPDPEPAPAPAVKPAPDKGADA